MVNKKILFINVADPWLTNGGDRPSLGTLYLASWLRDTNSAEPQVIDLNHYGDAGLIKRLYDFKPEVVGISMTTPQYEEAVRIARKIKSFDPYLPIIGGGPHVTAMQNVPKVPELLPIDCYDFCVIGEGFTPLEKICKEGYPNSRIIRSGGMPQGRSLDWLPLPARDLVDIDKYSLKILGKKAQPIMTSFGCPHSCSFCSEPQLNNRFKAHGPERVIIEMTELKEKYGTESLIIYDDVYSIDARRAIEIGKKMREKGLDLTYRCTTRATDFTRCPGLGKELKDSGCAEVCIGLESAHDDILKKNDKGMSVEQNRLGLEEIRKNEMRCLTYMITGLPGCSRKTEEASLNFIQEIHADECGWYMLAPFPSTGIWVNRQEYGVEIFEDEIIKNNWDVAQCRSDNSKLTCYLSYEKTGGLNRHQIKELWLEMIDKFNKYRNIKNMMGIQDSNEKIGGIK